MNTSNSTHAAHDADELLHSSSPIYLSICLVFMIIGISSAELMSHCECVASYMIPESALLVALGAILGTVLVTLPSSNLSHSLLKFAEFDKELFNLVLLPIIIFCSGYTIHPRKMFLKQLGTISILAIVGTLISAFVVGSILWGSFQAELGLSVWDSIAYGSLIVAIDPVSTIETLSLYPGEKVILI